jgi:hypothetical protein
VIRSQITKFTKILCHENLELYGTSADFACMHVVLIRNIVLSVLVLLMRILVVTLYNTAIYSVAG